MKNYALIAIALLVLLASTVADAQWRSKTHDEYKALTGIEIKIDGDLGEWDGVLETVTGTDGKPFCGVEFEGVGGKVAEFEEHGGGKWNGAKDHETCFMIVWDEEAVYIALSVTDDEHEHAAGQAWNGDGAQIAFDMTGDREAGGGGQLFLYNMGLDDAAKNVIMENEKTHGAPQLVDDDVAIVRDEGEKKTYYELRFPAEALKENEFSAGDAFGLGICVNDGDKGAGQNGQKGWSGWYTHSVVHGKNSEKTGLLTLTDEVLAVEAANKLTTTWGKLKSPR